MPNICDSLQDVLGIEGAEAAALVDLNTGFVLGCVGDGRDIELEAAACADLVHTRDRVMRTLGQQDGVEDVLLTTWKSFVIVRRVVTELTFGQNLLLFVKLRKHERGSPLNLAMTRLHLKRIESGLVV